MEDHKVNSQNNRRLPVAMLKRMDRVHLAVAVPFVVFALVYAPAAGRGFISDDYRWILESRIRTAGDLPRLFSDTTGFYRPVVSLSFALNERIGGTNARVYGWFNLILAVLSSLSIGCLVRLVGMPRGASWFAAAVWLLNFHGINMAVLWISGRTALLLVLFSTLAAIAVLRGRRWLAAVLTLAAMLSKEEAVLLPVTLIILAELMWPATQITWRTRLQLLGILAIPAAMYFALRSGSDAMTPTTAPPFYRFTFEPAVVGRNILEYLDRGATLAVACLAIILAVVRGRPRLSDLETRVTFVGLTWFVVGYMITVFLPVRSSLYACFPAAGAAITSAAVASAIWRAASDKQHQVLISAAIVIPLMLIPAYLARNDRWTALADISHHVYAQLQRDASSTQIILLVDDRSRRANIWSAFGSLLPDAVELATGRRQAIWVIPPPSDTSPEQVQTFQSSVDAAWSLQGSRLHGIDASAWLGTPALLLR